LPKKCGNIRGKGMRLELISVSLRNESGWSMYDLSFDRKVFNKYYGAFYLKLALILVLFGVALFFLIQLIGVVYPILGWPMLLSPFAAFMSLCFYVDKRRHAKIQFQEIKEGVLFGDIPTKSGFDGVAIGHYNYGTSYICRDVTNIVFEKRYIVITGDIEKNDRAYTSVGRQTGGKETQSFVRTIKLPRTFKNAERLNDLLSCQGSTYIPDQDTWEELLHWQGKAPKVKG
jgi:hypothetical protein